MAEQLPIIRMQRLTKRFGGKEVLKNLSLSVEPGALALLTGPSGSGKSTLLRLIAGMETPNRGRVIVNGQDLAHLSRHRVPFYRRQLGIVFQDHRLLNDRSVHANVALPLEVMGCRGPERARRVRAALDKVGLLDREESYPNTLSAGEQQRIGIARAIVHRPALLLADEPTGNLDPRLSLEVMQLFLDFNRIGMTVLIASHDVSLLSQFKLPVLYLEGGRIVVWPQVGSREES